MNALLTFLILLYKRWDKSHRLGFHPLSEARNTQLCCSFSGAFTLSLHSGNAVEFKNYVGLRYAPPNLQPDSPTVNSRNNKS